MQDAIISHPFASGFSEQHRRVLTARAREVEFRAGELIFREGEPANRFYLIQEGQVALEATELSQSVVIQNLHRGDVLGWSWLFAPFTWHFRARAVERTKAISLDGGHLLVTCEENHEFGYQMMKRVAQVVIQRLQA